jgi:hypothetical protein
LCHSFVRCNEIGETIKEVTSFCSEVIEVIDLDTSDLTEVNLKLKKSLANSSSLKSRIVIMTPSLAIKMQEKNLFNALGNCHSLVLDKIDLLQALDFGSDLVKLNNFKPSYRCIITTTDQRAEPEKSVTEVSEYKEIKKVFMGSDKALVIKLNHDEHRTTSTFERINHLYAMCDSNLDKFMLLFSFIKLAIV